MKSTLFYTDQYVTIAQRVTKFLNGRQDYLSAVSIKSTRAVGDAIQDVLANDFNNILADERIKYSTGFARRAMADLAFEDHDGFYYVVDVKTHRLYDRSLICLISLLLRGLPAFIRMTRIISCCCLSAMK